MRECVDCGTEISPNSLGRCKSCAAKARWARPEFKEKCGKAISAALNQPDVREHRSRSIAIAMNRPETSALLRRPKSGEARRNNRLAQQRPELRELHSRLSRGEKNYFYGKHWRGTDSPNYGRKHSDETRRKIAEAKAGLCGPLNPFFGKRHSVETRTRNAQAHVGKHMGPDNPNWTGGVFVDPYDRTFTKMVKNQVRERDGGACRLCGKPEGKRHHHVHHINYDMRSRDLSDLITLCVPCHKLVHKQKKIWPPILRTKIATK